MTCFLQLVVVPLAQPAPKWLPSTAIPQPAKPGPDAANRQSGFRIRTVRNLSSDFPVAHERARPVRAFFIVTAICQKIVSVENLYHPRDRKSTRLNSSHSQISYAVFCLKKKKKE